MTLHLTFRAEATDIGSPATFAGQGIDGSAILVRYTITGDANLDQRVDVADLYALALNWQTTGRRWSKGDFNYDTNVNLTDLQILSTNWDKTVSGASLGPLIAMPPIVPLSPPPPPPVVGTLTAATKRTATKLVTQVL